MAEPVAQPALQQVGRPVSLIPVGLKEAALDSPTFRATAVHFSDQIEIIEKWLESYVRATSKLAHDVSSLEETINSFLTRSVPPTNVSEAARRWFKGMVVPDHWRGKENGDYDR
jgi:hypothetical protein